MCGIVGVIGSRPAAPLILDALRRLEYRGYDSAGIATLVNGHIERRRAEGKLGNLAAALDRSPLAGTTGIGHTRWATHGAPTESNAHPHGTARVSVVHNGIIENHAELRAELEARGPGVHAPRPTPRRWRSWSICNLQRGMDAGRGGRRGVPPAGRRLCAGDDLRRPSRADRRRAARRAAGGGLRRGRDVRRLRRAGAGAADPAHRLSERRRLDRGRPQGRALLRRRRRTRCSAR